MLLLFYWNSFIALTSVCNTPSVSGMPDKAPSQHELKRGRAGLLI